MITVHMTLTSPSGKVSDGTDRHDMFWLPGADASSSGRRAHHSDIGTFRGEQHSRRDLVKDFMIMDVCFILLVVVPAFEVQKDS